MPAPKSGALGRACAPAVAIAALVFLLMATSAQAGTYTVRWGDTLSGIANHHHISLTRLARINHISAYGVLQTGRVLRVPGHATHHRRRAAKRHPHHVRHPKRHRAHARHHRRRHVHAGIHTVRAGETLSLIASRYHSSVRILTRANHRRSGQVLLVGTRLLIPLRHRSHHHRAHHRRRHHHRAARHHRHRVYHSAAVRAHPWVVGMIDHWAHSYSIDRHLVRAIGWQESGYNPSAVSSVGARGVLQVMPGTWTFTERMYIGRHVPHSADGGVHVGVAYLRALLRIFHGNERLAVAAYYQGPGAVQAYGIFPGSRAYVRNVLALRRRM